MFTDLAFVDWLALVFAAVLFAAASAAVVIAVATSSDRPKPLLAVKRRRSTRSDDAQSLEADEGDKTVESTWVTPPKPIVRPHPTERQSHTDVSPARAVHGRQSVLVPEIEADAAVAARAAKLRGRPVPEAPALRHRKRIESVVSNHIPAHAKTLDSTDSTDSTVVGGRSGFASDNFESTEGFKARGPGFFDDPMGRHELRYWDGHTWTEYVKESGERFTDPL